jgi:large subunit ribosomal protein L4e
LNNVFGTHKNPSKNFTLPTHEVSNPDLQRVINSNEIQSVIRNARTSIVHHDIQRKNPLRNKKAHQTINPVANTTGQAARKAN